MRTAASPSDSNIRTHSQSALPPARSIAGVISTSSPPFMSGNSYKMANALYYGDNLTVLRNEIASESVDLIYLDPPFNSNASYNVLFKEPSGKGSGAQI